MFSNGKSFMKRASCLWAELKNKTYPSAATLARLAGCERGTAQRTIRELQDDFVWPIEYDEERHGYYLTDPNFECLMPSASREELTVLLLLRDLAGVLNDEELREKIEHLWSQYIVKNPKLSGEPQRVAECFSSDLTIVGALSEYGLLDLLSFASKATPVETVYRSPWRDKEDKVYRGIMHRVHFSDGNLYILFTNSDEKTKVFNASFIKKIAKLEYNPLEGKIINFDKDWPKGFGIWHGEKIEDVEIRIRPPGSLYFEKQTWNEDQEDSWEGEILVRRLKSAISPQLVNRILSLGSLVVDVKPEELKKKVLEQAQGIVANLQGE